MEKPEKTQYFVDLEDPLALRRQLVESSIIILNAFKNHQRYQRLAEEKIQQMRNVRTFVEDLKNMNKQLLSFIPKIHLKYHGEFPQQSPVSAVSTDELKRLEQEIKSIESALSSLE